MGLVVLRPGMMATIQDQGRPGYQRYGVPVGGASDLGSHDLANGLLGNSPDAATLELTMLGGSFRAESDLAIALAGASLAATVQEEDLIARTWLIPRTGTLRAGETLTLGGSAVGLRCYLAVRGGWQTPLILGSRSSEQPIRQGDRLNGNPGTTSDRRPSSDLLAALSPSMTNKLPIRWMDGLDRCLTDLTGSYRVLPESNRIGVRLDGGAVEVAVDPNRLSQPVAAGAIQVAGGQPLILGRAGGSIGGYPHVGQVISVDLDRLGQLRPGDAVEFERVELDEARRLDAEARQLRRVWQARLQVWAEV